MQYNLSNPIEVQSAESRFRFLASKEKTIILTEKRKKRTYKQNRYLHLILGWFGLETGYTLAETKHLYKRYNSEIYVYRKNGIEFFKSSADLDTKEMTLSIEKFRNYAQVQGGVYLPAPNETEQLNHIEKELGKYESRVYS